MDTDTFTNEEVIQFSKSNFINLKMNTDTGDGFELFKNFHGISLPTILFLDSNGNEIDRLIGYVNPTMYLTKIHNIKNGINTLDYFLTLYQSHPDSNNLALEIGNKYLERNITDTAKTFFLDVLRGTNSKYHQEANYRLAFLEYENDNLDPLLNFIDNNPNSDFSHSGLRSVIRYYRALSDTTSELTYYQKLISLFPTDPNALNSYGWRMSELEMNLEDALIKTRLAVSLSNDNPQSKANILDTEAEILWKLGQIEEAIDVIDRAIIINPEKKYFIDQKNKFSKSL